MKNIYFIEITDTFGGEANYSWVRRYLVRASSERGAVCILARHYGAGWINDGAGRYNLRGACVCLFVEWVDEADVDEFVDRYLTIEKLNF